jgi:hypothetical protein
MKNMLIMVVGPLGMIEEEDVAAAAVIGRE